MPNFSNQTTPVYLAISSARGLCPLHIFTIALSTIMGMKYLLVILICVFLMTNDDDERLFLCAYWHLFIFYGKMSIRIICSF